MLDVFYFQFYILLIYMSHCESSNRALCSCDNLNSTKINSIVQCQLCSNNQCSSDSGCRNNIQKSTQARIQNQVRVSESQLLDVNSAFAISFKEDNEKVSALREQYPPNKRDSRIYGNKLNLRNQSDRTFPSGSGLNNVPTRGNSLTTTITRNRPGAMAPGGIGVDVKHGSYARYLAKIKASNIVGPKDTKYGPFDNQENDVNDSVYRLAKQNAGMEGRLQPAVNNKQFRFSFGFKNDKCFNCS